MDPYGKMNLGKLTEQLQEYLTKFGNGLGLLDEEDKGARAHPYGPINSYGELGDIHQIINAMKLRCDQLKSSENAVKVLKFSQESHLQEEISNPLKSCLKDTIEKLRNAAPDLTLKSVLQKLQAISEETGLKFDHGGQTGTDCFISSDMFYFEIKLNSTGGIIDVREQLHSGEPKSCRELADILRERNYKEFKTRLKGLADLYRIKVDTFMKSSQIFAALEAVETDIIKLSRVKEGFLDELEALNNSLVGYIFQRQGGQLMQLTFFANPIEITCKQSQVSSSENNVISRDFGLSSEIAVESANTYRLPTSSLVIVDDQNRVRYGNLDSNNSDELPASLVMRLTKPFPISASCLNEIHTILTKSASDQFVHASEASLDNLVIKKELNMKSREDWSRKPLLVTLPDEGHVYRISPSDTAANIGFVIVRLPFQHPSQVPLIIKVLRRQAVYNLLLTSCTGKQTEVLGKENLKYFDVKATDSSSIEVSFQHPLHMSMCSVNFVVSSHRNVQATLITAPGAPVFCSQVYMENVVNRCLSIPITMRCILRKAACFVPSKSADVDVPTSKDESSRPKQLKLLIPSFTMDNSGSIPLVSPGIRTNLLPTFSLGSDSASGSSFQFPVPDLAATLPGGYTKPAFASPKKGKDPLGKPATPGTPKSRTMKLPKITLKRKRDGDEYEIDKEKSNFDVLEESDAQTIAESLADDAKQILDQSGVSSKRDGAQLITENQAIQGQQPRDLSFTTSNMPFDLSVDNLSTNAISINSVGELEGLLGPSIDVSSLMGSGLVTQLGIAGSTFPDGFSGITSTEGVSENQVEAFDLDAISGGSNISFGVDDSLSGVQGAAIDPSMVVSSSASLSNAPVFDVHQSLIDIDSFIMGAEEGGKSTANQSSMGGE
ncbi:mediator of RNA polymerase II transcription subunit 1-like [Rhopilema esculentum]|uniref:mediator of RNA polymerase II transcription subunit 1-like n=1 Tax=Rhopilema esculentum TaxID=499914 RepID=UPI0031D694E9